MTEFKNLRKQIASARAEAETLSRRLLEAKEKLRTAEKKIGNVTRSTPESLNNINASFVQRKQELQREISSLGKAHKVNKKQVYDLLSSFAQLGEPSAQVEELDDAFPFLLFPVRLETRFKKVTINETEQDQLWVRIFPDDCQVVAREEMLSESEITTARTFWKDFWQAGGIEPDQRAAWRILVDNFGPGRAAWIIDQFKPLNPDDKKVKRERKDFILVIDPEMALTPNEETAAFTFWKKFWLADTDLQKQEQATDELILAVGENQARQITLHFRPFNIASLPLPPFTKNEVTLEIEKIILPADVVTASASWLQSPKAKTLPDRFVVMLMKDNQVMRTELGNPIPDNLAVGPDPSLPDNEQLKSTEDGNLFINEDLAWMIDFEKAIAAGMGLKINISAIQARDGFDGMLVLGLRLSEDQDEGRASLENLFRDHYYSKHGLGIVKQGTPSNNTEFETSGYTAVDEADQSYDVMFKATYINDSDYLNKKDGQWLAEYLGIDKNFFKKVVNGASADQGEARAMNMAMLPATIVYYMEEMMTSAFSEEDIENTRLFFYNYVSGRGPIPAIRIGKQPYGILPATAFSRIESQRPFPPTSGTSTYISRLYNVLKTMDAEWSRFVPLLPHVGMPGDTDQLLMDILTLHSGSVEFYGRWGESVQHLYNQAMLQGGEAAATKIKNLSVQKASQLLQDLGLDIGQSIPILEKYFQSTAFSLRDPLVDDVPLSETDDIRPYSTDGKNYIEWLVSSNVDKIRTQDFGGNPPPTAMLYLYLRHALLLAIADEAFQLHKAAGLETSKANFRDPPFIHVQESGGGRSKFEYLFKKEPRITGDDSYISDYISKADLAQGFPEPQWLRKVKQSLNFLKNTPTARLERVFTEHLDCCTYRLDAWKLGLINHMLISQRTTGAPPFERWSQGIYLGCYGWLDEVRPEQKSLTPVTLSDELASIFQGEGQLVRDDKNLGYMHAPSLNQAATAAVMRNAYETNKNSDPSVANPYSINLSSERVRLARQFLEGARNGQSLAALLGYQFERGLHDKYSLGKGEVDKFIYPLRKKFPLVSGKLKGTDITADESKETAIDNVEARNVIDGLKFIRHIRNATEKTYPFGLPVGPDKDQVPAANTQQQTAITEEANRIINIADAISDLVTAESVYQVVQGNFERSSGTLEAFSKGKRPPEIEVTETPRSGIVITHRVGMQFDTSADPESSPTSVAEMSVRASLEPAVNKWLADILPPPENILCKVRFKRPDLPEITEMQVSQKDLNLQPIDLLYIVSMDAERSMTALDDAIQLFMVTNHSPDPGTSIAIDYSSSFEIDRLEASFFEISALIKSLRGVLLRSKPLNAADVAVPGEISADTLEYNHGQLQERVEVARTKLTDKSVTLLALSTDPSETDPFIKKVAAEFFGISLFGIPQTGTGRFFDGIRNIYRSIQNRVLVTVRRWEQKKLDFDAVIAVFDISTAESEQALLLQKAEQIISTTSTFPVPDIITYKSIVDNKKSDFDAVLSQLRGLLTAGTESLNNYFQEAEPVLALIASHDVIFFNIEKETNDASAERQQAVALKEQAIAAVLNLKSDIDRRIAETNTLLAGLPSIPASSDKVQQLLAAAKKIFGDDVIVLPHFLMPEQQGNEWENAFGNRERLLTYLKTNRQVQFPVDDWLSGVARVREKIFHLENTALLTNGFKPGRDVDITPLQFPFRPDDSYRWLAMQFRDDEESYSIDSDTLLYSAHFAVPFNKTQMQCGVLVDEWTEVIPSKEESTGIGFHYDQPNTEPPQTLMLVIPSRIRGTWRWDDLVDGLSETFMMAKKRAVEPQQLDTTGYAQLLPATMMATTRYPITVSANLNENNEAAK